MEIPFIGGSYDLDNRHASVQRTVNLIPTPEEPGNERTAWVFKDAPGLESWSSNQEEEIPLCTHYFTDTFFGAAESAVSTHTPDVCPTDLEWQLGGFKFDGTGRTVPNNISAALANNLTNVFSPIAIDGNYIVKCVITRAGSANQSIAVKIDGNGGSYIDIGLTRSGTNALAVFISNYIGGLSYLILTGLSENSNPQTIVVKIIGGLAYEIYLDDVLVGAGSSAAAYMTSFNRISIRSTYIDVLLPAQDVAINEIDISDCAYPP